jgi:hypothetical protein
MMEVDSNHCQIVRESIVGKRTVDEQTFASLTILTERLERLKKLDEVFGNVAFSPAVEKLARQKDAVAVG